MVVAGGLVGVDVDDGDLVVLDEHGDRRFPWRVGHRCQCGGGLGCDVRDDFGAEVVTAAGIARWGAGGCSGLRGWLGVC